MCTYFPERPANQNTVTSFDNGLTLWNSLEQEHNYDLVLLDMMLPGVDGFSLLPKLRDYDIPVICLTAMGDALHEVQGLRGGAEDYIAKPFDMLALLTRMEKVLQRCGKLNPVYHFQGLTLDYNNRTLTRNSTEISLPALEFDVLAVLMKTRTEVQKNTPKLSFRGVILSISQRRRAAERSDGRA